MQMIPVSSSSILAIGYDVSFGILRISFRNGGIYDYHGVPGSIARQFLSAPSKGKFYGQFIKGRFNPHRIG